MNTVPDGYAELVVATGINGWFQATAIIAVNNIRDADIDCVVTNAPSLYAWGRRCQRSITPACIWGP